MSATLIPHTQAGNVLYQTYGPASIMFEQYVFAFADSFMENNDIALWQFYRTESGLVFMVPPKDVSLTFPNQYSATMAPMTAGLVLSLYALCALCSGNYPEAILVRLIDQYHELRNYALTTEDASVVYRAID